VVQLPDDFSGFRKWHQGLLDGALEQSGQQQEQEVTPRGSVTREVFPSGRGDTRSTAPESAGRPSEEALTALPLPLVSTDPLLTVGHLPLVAPRSDTLAEQLPQDSSFEEDLRVYRALPDYSSAALSEPPLAPADTSRSTLPGTSAPSELPAAGEQQGLHESRQEAAPESPTQKQLSAITQQIDAEEAELADYLSWLEAQQQQQQQQQRAPAQEPVLPQADPPTAQPLQQRQPTTVRLPAETGAARPGPAHHPAAAAAASGIPRYVTGRPASMDVAGLQPSVRGGGSSTGTATADGTAPARVFSPRDAAMRAEQPVPVRSRSTVSRSGRSAFEAQSLYGSY
jgi:hypothetical protein